jgi:hypothetical protein
MKQVTFKKKKKKGGGRTGISPFNFCSQPQRLIRGFTFQEFSKSSFLKPQAIQILDPPFTSNLRVVKNIKIKKNKSQNKAIKSTNPSPQKQIIPFVFTTCLLFSSHSSPLSLSLCVLLYPCSYTFVPHVCSYVNLSIPFCAQFCADSH